jgi:hypothetical protein
MLVPGAFVAVVVGGVVVPPVVVPPVVVVPPAPPDAARTSAMPDSSPAKNVAVATPFFVCASTGSTLPRDVLNRTVVPFCTGVPDDSMTCASIVVLPPVGNMRVPAVNVIVELVGAVSGARSQELAIAATMKPVARVVRLNIMATVPNTGCR